MWYAPFKSECLNKFGRSDWSLRVTSHKLHAIEKWEYVDELCERVLIAQLPEDYVCAKHVPYQLPPTVCKLQAASYKQQAASHKLQAAKKKLQTTRHKPQAASRKLAQPFALVGIWRPAEDRECEAGVLLHQCAEATASEDEQL